MIEILDLDKEKKYCVDEYHYDIIFLFNRLNVLFENEEYEKIPTIMRWIDELFEIHHGIIK